MDKIMKNKEKYTFQSEIPSFIKVTIFLLILTSALIKIMK